MSLTKPVPVRLLPLRRTRYRGEGFWRCFMLFAARYFYFYEMRALYRFFSQSCRRIWHDDEYPAKNAARAPRCARAICCAKRVYAVIRGDIIIMLFICCHIDTFCHYAICRARCVQWRAGKNHNQTKKKPILILIQTKPWQ